MGSDSPNPPSDPEVKKIIDTLAAYVAKNGMQFESVVREREKSNPQFFFLRGGEYNAYYLHCIQNEQRKIAATTTQSSILAAQVSSANDPMARVRQAVAQLQTEKAIPPSSSLSSVQQRQPSPVTQQPPAQTPSVSGSYPQSFAPTPDSQEHIRNPYGFPPSGQAMPPRFYPPPWLMGDPTRPQLIHHDLSQMPPNQQGYPGPFPMRSRFPPVAQPSFPMQNQHMFPAGYGGPPERFRPFGHPMGNFGFSGGLVSDSYPIEPNLPPQRHDPRPWYDLPAGVMLAHIRTEETNYRSLDPNSLSIPPPQPITDSILKALDSYYAPPNPSQPRSAEGFEKLGLYDFYKAKDAAKKALQRGEPPRQYHPGRSRSPTPESRYRSRSRSSGSRSRSSRYSSRSRSRSPNRHRRSGSPRRRSRSHS